MYFVCDAGTMSDVCGAIIQSRMDRVVIGCMNLKAGCCAGSVLNLLQVDRFNHQADVTRGVLEEKCSELMKSFSGTRLPDKWDLPSLYIHVYTMSDFFFLCIALRTGPTGVTWQFKPRHPSRHPEGSALVLLRSRPDTVHGFPSRKTRISTSLTKGSPASFRPSAQYHPCYSGLQVQPLPPRLHGSLFYLVLGKMSMNLAIFHCKFLWNIVE